LAIRTAIGAEMYPGASGGEGRASGLDQARLAGKSAIRRGEIPPARDEFGKIIWQ